MTGFLMWDLQANTQDYVEGGAWVERRRELSRYLDSTDPDPCTLRKGGDKMIVAIGTNGALVSPGEKPDYYQSVIDKKGRENVDAFARFHAPPQTNHELGGTN